MLPCCLDVSTQEHLYNIENRPHVVFAVDLLFFLSNESKILCLPHCNESYEIHPRSPLTKDIRQLIKMCHTRHECYYLSLYRAYEVLNNYSKSDMFHVFTRELENDLDTISFQDISENSAKKDIISKLVNAAKLSVVFHECCTDEAGSFVTVKIAEVLDKCNDQNDGSLFDSLSNYAYTATRMFPS